MKDEEDIPKKKGWFSSKKKKSTASLRSVSRPPRPSTDSNSTSRSSTSTPDQELPPRTENAGSPTPDDKKVPPTDETAESQSPLPSRAGFDFDAIKEVLGKAELNPEELQIRTPNPFTPPPILPPTSRSESTPHPLRDSSTLSGRSPGLSAPPDISASFSRSLSLNNVQDMPESVESSESLPNEDTERRSRSPTPISARWASSNEQISPSSPYGNPSTSTFGAETLSFVNNGSPITRSSYNPPPMHNPFSPSNPNLSSSLTFGGADGSITNPNAENLQDPWAFPNDRKKASTLSLNPWSN
jgi:hypothetical protein